ncbi:hypothetical protein AKJ16_DCAP04868 [Drosera capensis]
MYLPQKFIWIEPIEYLYVFCIRGCVESPGLGIAEIVKISDRGSKAVEGPIRVCSWRRMPVFRASELEMPDI